MSEEMKTEEVVEETREEMQEPAAEVAQEAVAEAVQEPAAEAVQEPVAEAAQEPVAEAAQEPVAEAAQEPKEEEPQETMADLEEHFDDANPWNRVIAYQKDKTVLHVTVEGIVNGGVIAKVEGLRGFIPASKMSLSYIENLETYLQKELDVQVIDVDQASNRLILSARELLKAKERKEMSKKIESLKVGTVIEGKVESIQNYGAFVRMEDGLSGLIHISQVSHKHIKSLKGIMNVGDTVTAKIIGIKEGKISLSMRALEDPDQDEPYEKVDIPKAENIGTSLGDLFKNIKL